MLKILCCQVHHQSEVHVGMQKCTTWDIGNWFQSLFGIPTYTWFLKESITETDMTIKNFNTTYTELCTNLQQFRVWANLKFGKTSGQLPEVDLNF